MPFYDPIYTKQSLIQQHKKIETKIATLCNWMTFYFGSSLIGPNAWISKAAM